MVKFRNVSKLTFTTTFNPNLICLFLRLVRGLSVKTFISKVALHLLASNSSSFWTTFPPWVQHWYCFLNLIFGPVFDIFFAQTVVVISEKRSTHSSHNALKSSLSLGIWVRNLTSNNLSSVHFVCIISNLRSIPLKIWLKSEFALLSPAILFTVRTLVSTNAFCFSLANKVLMCAYLRFILLFTFHFEGFTYFGLYCWYS